MLEPLGGGDSEPPALHERSQPIIEGQVHVAEPACLPELHLADADFGQAVVRALPADDDAEFRLVRPGRSVRMS